VGFALEVEPTPSKGRHMKLINALDFTDKQWYDAHCATYNKDLGFHIGVDPRFIANPPSLVDFYKNITQAIENGTFQTWGIQSNNGEFLGYTYLDKSVLGEWEIGAALSKVEERGRGWGAKASLLTMKWAFETDKANWLVAFTQGKDPKVPEMLERVGFVPFSNFRIMSREAWDNRWLGRLNKWEHYYQPSD
jgi:RimJ/RimL family protein N-acetyltransferase